MNVQEQNLVLRAFSIFNFPTLSPTKSEMDELTEAVLSILLLTSPEEKACSRPLQTSVSWISLHLSVL